LGIAIDVRPPAPTDLLTTMIGLLRRARKASGVIGMRFKAEAAIIVLSLLASVPFLDQAFHVDEPNFLALASHASPNPLMLYDFSINWLGTEERAFDVLSNPPLVPWYLALIANVAQGREWVFRLAFWPFIVLALLGTWRLGRRFAGPRGAVWTLCWSAVAPAFVLASHTVMPDLPLLAFYTLGIALAIEGLDRANSRLALAGGALAGVSALCRYSGMTAIPLLILYIVLYRPQPRPARLVLVGSIAPLAVWSCVSQMVYGQIHWVTMAGFQANSLTFAPILHRGFYQFCAIGLTIVPAAVLAGALDLRWLELDSSRKWAFVGGLIGLGWGLLLSSLSGTSGPLLLVPGLAGGGVVGGVALQGVLAGFRKRVWAGLSRDESDPLFLAAWLFGLVAFNLALRFASVRYLLPALPVAVLLVQRTFSARPGAVLRRSWAALAVLTLSLALSKADADFANVYRDYVAALPPPAKTRWFTGHWGLQYYLEQTGAKPLSPANWPLLRPGDEIVVPTYASPQSLPKPPEMSLPTTLEFLLITRSEIPARPGLRTFTLGGRACFYASMMPGPTLVLLPFGIAAAPLEILSRFEAR
jgi:4-amino-4-deoxy-L-arabinose transferase-like glycosyltransferase